MTYSTYPRSVLQVRIANIQCAEQDIEVVLLYSRNQFLPTTVIAITHTFRTGKY